MVFEIVQNSICFKIPQLHYIGATGCVITVHFAICRNIGKVGPGTNTKHKSKGEAFGQRISLNLIYPHTTNF